MKHRLEKQHLILALLFMAKTIPQVFFLMALPVILRMEGYSLKVISLFQLAGAPYLLKFLWAPFLDIKSLEKNHYKQWTLWSGMVYGLLIICMAFLNIREQFQAIVYLVMVVAFVASTQDIAISALYIKLLNYEQRGIGSSSKVFALNLATIAGSGFFLILYNHTGWRAAMLTMGAIILLALVSLCFLEENKQYDRVPRHKIPWSSLLTFFRGSGMVRWFILITVNSISVSAIFFMVKPFLVDRGVDPDTIAFLVGFYGMSIAAVVAMASGNRVIQTYMLHRRKAYIGCAIINAVAVAIFIPVSLQKDLFCLLYIAVALLNTAITLSSVVSSTLVMDFSRKGLESIDYSLQMTGIHIGGLAMAAASGFIVERTGYPSFFALQAFIGVALVVLTCFLFRGEWIPSLSWRR